MNFRATLASVLFSAVTFVAVAPTMNCSNGPAFNVDAGSDGGKEPELGANPSVPQTCQSCLTGSSSNECANKAKVCNEDPNCVALNACVNNCASVNSGCVSNCADAASTDVQSEWLGWYNCTCTSCASQCSSAFCFATTPDDAGKDSGPPTCLS